MGMDDLDGEELNEAERAFIDDYLRTKGIVGQPTLEQFVEALEALSLHASEGAGSQSH